MNREGGTTRARRVSVPKERFDWMYGVTGIAGYVLGGALRDARRRVIRDARRLIETSCPLNG